jgi:hypothetical protein
VGVWVGSGVRVNVAVGNMVEGAMVVAVGLTTGAFELHDDMTMPTMASKHNNDFFIVLIFTLNL